MIERRRLQLPQIKTICVLRFEHQSKKVTDQMTDQKCLTESD